MKKKYLKLFAVFFDDRKFEFRPNQKTDERKSDCAYRIECGDDPLTENLKAT